MESRYPFSDVDFLIAHLGTFFIMFINLVSAVGFIVSLALYAYLLPDKIPSRLPVLWENNVGYIVFYFVIGIVALFSGFFNLLGKKLNSVASVAITFLIHISTACFLGFGAYSMFKIVMPIEYSSLWTLATYLQGIACIFQVCFVMETVLWLFFCRPDTKYQSWSLMSPPRLELRSTLVNDPFKDSGF